MCVLCVLTVTIVSSMATIAACAIFLSVMWRLIYNNNNMVNFHLYAHHNYLHCHSLNLLSFFIFPLRASFLYVFDHMVKLHLKLWSQLHLYILIGVLFTTTEWAIIVCKHPDGVNLKDTITSIPVSNKVLFLYCCQNCLRFPTDLAGIGWVTWAIWAIMRKYSTFYDDWSVLYFPGRETNNNCK